MSSSLRVIYRIEVASVGPRLARAIVATELAGRVRKRTLEEMTLLVSELVTHRVRHGRVGETITLELRAADTVGCAVIDEGPAALPADLGLTLIDRLAGRWGVIREHRRTHTWAEAGAGWDQAQAA